jgi:phosphonate transport system permease protein
MPRPAPTAPATPAARFPASVRKSTFGYALAAAFAVALATSLRMAQVDPRLLVDPTSLANAARFIEAAFPPRLSAEFLTLIVRPAVETVQISVIGTVIAAVIGAPLALLATSSLAWRGILHERTRGPARWLLGLVPYALARGVLSVFRSIPEYVWAFMFVRAVGLGPFPGVLALGVAYGGMLGKVYSEILESVSPQPMEALHAAGASRFQTFVYAMLPQALPQVVSYTLYRWECAIRASAILGFVGAGGLGQQIELSMRMFQFDEVVTLLGVLFMLVASVDLISARVRARILR